MFNFSPYSNNNNFRRRRIDLLNKIIKKYGSQDKCRIIDLGGTSGFWHVWREHIDWRRVEVTLVNIDPNHAQKDIQDLPIFQERGNACDLKNVSDNQYDIVFSNSVIEHVGLFRDMQRFAVEVHRISPRHVIQTPNFWFPIEPHARAPFIHWLPHPWRRQLIRRRRMGFWPKAETVIDAQNQIESARMLDLHGFKSLFPNSTVHKERFMGFTKSFIALRE